MVDFDTGKSCSNCGHSYLCMCEADWMAPPTKPERRIVFALEIQADTYGDVRAELRNIVYQLVVKSESEDAPIVGSMISGGVGSGSIVTVRENPEMDHDKYFELMEAYLEKQPDKEEAPRP